MLGEIAEIINEHFAEPCAYYHCKHPPDQIVLQGLRRIFVSFTFYPVDGEKIDNGKCDKIHQAVVAQLKRTNAENRGANV